MSKNHKKSGDIRLSKALSRAATLGGISFFCASGAYAQAPFVLNGEAGFVVSHIQYALSKDAEETGACPNGMTEGYANFGDVFLDRPDLQRRPEEKEDEYVGRAFRAAFGDADAKNLCLNPELGEPNPTFRTVVGADTPAYGIDLDGQDSRADGAAPEGACPHSDFVGVDGGRGVDNQFYRVVGCSNSYQSTGQSNTFEIEMYTGAWGILISLSGVDDIRNDDEVEVGFYANADPMQLSPGREPLEYATYAMTQDPRYRATARGRIVDGLLTTEPTDMRFHWIVNNIRLERPLVDAVASLTISEDGVLDGYLAGYTSVEDMYDLKYGFRNGLDAVGGPAPLRLRAGSSIGAAAVLGHTCEGAYYALHEHADGHFDPDSGKCTSISTQYKIEAIPAFLVDEETASLNEELEEASTGVGGDDDAYRN